MTMTEERLVKGLAREEGITVAELVRRLVIRHFASGAENRARRSAEVKP